MKRFQNYILLILSLLLLIGAGGINCFASQSDDGSDDIESLLDDYEKENREVVKNLEDNFGDLENPNPEALINAVGGNQKKSKYSGPPDIMDDPAKAMRFATSNFRKLSQQDLQEHIVTMSKGNVAGKIFTKSPRTLMFVARSLRDKDALPTLANIAKDKKKLSIFGLLNIGTIFLGMLLGSLTRKKTFLARINYFFIRIAILNGLRIGIFIYFYSVEITPLYQIFKRTYLS